MMMHGLPIVGTDSTGLSEMIIDGENGYKVNLNENENDVFLDTVRLSQLIKKDNKQSYLEGVFITAKPFNFQK